MEDIILSKIKECKLYCRSLSIFENYSNSLYNYLDHKYQTNIGYLIDLKEFEQYKKDLLFQGYKNNIDEYNDEIICKIVELNSLNKSLELKKLNK